MHWFHDHLPERQLVLDASALINILGCGAVDEVFGALSVPCLVEEKVIGEISKHPVPSLCHLAALESLVTSGFIEKVRMDDDEYAHYLSLVQAPLGQRLDEGESATLAIAHRRNLGVVMDENKGRNYVASKLPVVPVVSSLRLFVSAAYRLGRGTEFARQVIAAACRQARMGVPKTERDLLAEVLRADLGRDGPRSTG